MLPPGEAAAEGRRYGRLPATDPIILLTREAYRECMRVLRQALPMPVEKTPEAFASRDRAAIEQAAHLAPATPMRPVSPRLAALHGNDPASVRQLGRLPDNCDFEPPPPEVLDTIIHGDCSTLLWADKWEPVKPRAKD